MTQGQVQGPKGQVHWEFQGCQGFQGCFQGHQGVQGYIQSSQETFTVPCGPYLKVHTVYKMLYFVINIVQYFSLNNKTT